MKRILTATLMLATLNACGGSALEGDWFLCEDLACSQFDDDGIRFVGDGTAFTLDTDGGNWVPGQAYCHSQATFKWEELDDGLFTITDPDGDITSARYQVEGDMASITFGRVTVRYMQVPEPMTTLPCPGSTSGSPIGGSRSDTPDVTVEPGGGGNSTGGS